MFQTYSTCPAEHRIDRAALLTRVEVAASAVRIRVCQKVYILTSSSSRLRLLPLLLPSPRDLRLREGL